MCCWVAVFSDGLEATPIIVVHEFDLPDGKVGVAEVLSGCDGFYSFHSSVHEMGLSSDFSFPSRKISLPKLGVKKRKIKTEVKTNRQSKLGRRIENRRANR